MKTKDRQAWQHNAGVRLVRTSKGVYDVHHNGEVIGEVKRRPGYSPSRYRYVAYGAWGKWLGEFSTRKRAALEVIEWAWHDTREWQRKEAESVQDDDQHETS